MSQAQPRHWRALDGVRALAVGSVLIYHWNSPHLFTGGYLGVDMFFALSGFLITWGIALERDRSGGFSFGHFYARRALRLLPAVVAVVLFVGLLLATSLHGPAASQTLRGLPWILLYAGNWCKAMQVGNLGVLNHLWSLGVEEQFYVIWPIVILAFLRRGVRRERLAAAILAVAAVEAVYREVLYRIGVSVSRLAFGLDTHSDALLVGCAIALYLSSGRLDRIQRRTSLAAGAWGALAVIAVLVATGNGQTTFQWNYPITAAASGVLITALITGSVPLLRDILGSRLAVWVGRRSYGLYVWSYPIYYGLPWPKDFTGPPRYLAETALAFAVAAASYRFLELPFLRLKGRLGSIDRPAPDAVPRPARGPIGAGR